MKSFSIDQIQKYERDPEPIYFIHISLPAETLYFSDRNFIFNGHNYEAYLLDIPETVHSIERFGGYLNLNAQLTFRNQSFRSFNKLFDFFLANPITKREMDIYVLYIQDHAIPDSDVSTKLHSVAFGEPKRIQGDTFDFELFSILYTLDSKKLFTQINRANWPSAAPQAIGQYENQIIGSLKNIPCQCIDIGAITTLAADLAAGATEVYLSDPDYPIPFPPSGRIQIGFNYIDYTGKDSANKKLTGCVWKVPTHDWKRGEPLWEVRSTYKYLAQGAKSKAISNVYVAGVEVADADRTINLDDGGKTTIAFNSRALLKNQGSHTHGATTVKEFHPTGGSFNYSPNMGASGVPQSLYDLDDNTYCHVGVTGATDGPKDAYFTVTFPTYEGVTPDAVYVCMKNDWGLGAYQGEYWKLTVPQIITIGPNGIPGTNIRIKLSGTSVPGTVTCRAHTNQGTSELPCYLLVNDYEMWLELEFKDLPSSGESAAWQTLAPLVTCDIEGHKDDASGTYTGVANALIENPADVRKYILIALLGRSASDIGSSFGDMRTIYNNRSAPYKLAMNLPKVGLTLSEIFKRIDEQTRSQMREDSGKFELSFHPGPNGVYGTDFLPSNGTGITASGYYGASTPAKSCDNSDLTEWTGRYNTFSEWIQHDAGAGITHIARKLTIKASFNDSHARVKNFFLCGSNDGTTFIVLYTGQQADNNNIQSYTFFNSTPYRYYRLVVADIWAGAPLYIGIIEWELMEMSWSAPSEPTSMMTIDKTIFVGEPVFKMTPSVEIKNLLRALFDLDYGDNGDRKKFGDYFGQIEISDSTSITKYGELSEEITFPAVRDGGIVEDVVQWILVQKKDLIPMVEMVCNRLVRKLERDDYFTLIDCPVIDWEGDLWRVLEILESPELQQFKISAIKYIGN